VARTSKSPRAVVLAALATARRSLPEYAHRYSPKKFTQHQLFACLVLKQFLQADYRGLAVHLADNPSLVTVLGLKQVPHFTTFQKASQRLLRTAPVRKLLKSTVRLHLGRKRRVKRAAIDSTGLECTSASGYFVRRRSRVENPWKTVVYHHYPKLSVVASTDDHFVDALDARRGPRPDVDEFRPLVAEACRVVRLSQLAADAGYDSEGNHQFARDEHGIRTIIPAKHGRPTDKLPAGRYRRLMKVRFDRVAYRRRSQVETVVSMIKRRQGAHVHARTYHNQCRELRLIVLTHNIMILVVVEVFYTAVPDSVHGAGPGTGYALACGNLRTMSLVAAANQRSLQSRLIECCKTAGTIRGK
jgi:Transposase DDE domain